MIVHVEDDKSQVISKDGTMTLLLRSGPKPVNINGGQAVTEIDFAFRGHSVTYTVNIQGYRQPNNASPISLTPDNEIFIPLIALDPPGKKGKSKPIFNTSKNLIRFLSGGGKFWVQTSEMSRWTTVFLAGLFGRIGNVETSCAFGSLWFMLLAAV